jgi:hypothetical protein
LFGTRLDIGCRRVEPVVIRITALRRGLVIRRLVPFPLKEPDARGSVALSRLGIGGDVDFNTD